jgi:hypothetical protein
MPADEARPRAILEDLLVVEDRHRWLRANVKALAERVRMLGAASFSDAELAGELERALQ